MSWKSANRRAVFLDRDGVVLELVKQDGVFTSIKSRDQIQYRPGLSKFLMTAHRQGYALCMITNQPDISRGKQKLADVEAIHEQILLDHLLIEQVYFCPHDDQDLCSCRKPKPGLLTRSAAELKLDLQSSVVIGDRIRDLEASKNAGCQFILLRSQATTEDADERASHVGDSWREVTEIFLGKLGL